MGELEEVLKVYKVNKSNKKEEKIKKYLKELDDNRKWGNLVSKGFNERSEVMIADSLIILEVIKPEAEGKILDIGSGGGIVGIIISIVCEKLKVEMVEKSRRKSAFLAEMKSKLELENVKIMNMDAYDLKGRKEYEYSVTRATGKIKDIIELGMGVLKKDGIFLAIKGNKVEKEIEEAEEAIDINGGKIIEIVKKGRLGEEKNKRVSMVVIKKVDMIK